MHPYVDVPSDHPTWTSGTYIENYDLPGTGFPVNCFKTGDVCIPEDKANAILWDFYQVKFKDVVDSGVGFADSKNPNSNVKCARFE